MPFKLTTRRQTSEDLLAANVFKRIDMQRGDTTKCWEWQGFVDRAPITRINGLRWFVNRIVYGLKHGIPYSEVPKLTWLCGNVKCCNPGHMEPARRVKVRL